MKLKTYMIWKEKVISALDPVALFEALDAKIEKRATNSNHIIRVTCPIHKGNDFNMAYNTQTGFWTCFSHHCGEDILNTTGRQKPRDIVLLVQLSLNLSFPDAVQWLVNLSGVPADGLHIQVNKEELDRLANIKFIRSTASVRGEMCSQEISSELVDSYHRNLTGDAFYFLSKRGFSRETIDFFRIGYSNQKDDWFYDRITFPILDHHGRLTGISGRLLSEKKEEMKARGGKWRHQFNFSTGAIVPYLGIALEYAEKSKCLNLVEGPFDLAWFWQIGIRNTVPLLGSRITPDQVQLLVQYCPYDIVLCLDGDEGGERGAVQIGNALSSYFNVYVLPMPPGLDPDDLTPEQYFELYERRWRFQPKIVMAR